jgi:hypothetical protein
VQLILLISQEAIQLLSQEQGLVRGELKQHPLARLVLSFELVRAALAGRGDAGERLRLQGTRHEICLGMM